MVNHQAKLLQGLLVSIHQEKINMMLKINLFLLLAVFLSWNEYYVLSQNVRSFYAGLRPIPDDGSPLITPPQTFYELNEKHYKNMMANPQTYPQRKSIFNENININILECISYCNVRKNAQIHYNPTTRSISVMEYIFCGIAK
ncbi:hypothetical protein K1T71_009833 [Dendrolimus kikuchii]|uniref:Uncharacterized protein n=1 Tax=Dendrolimus kikuchii TaxID=765133 RepID=A0ACC1CTH1_9NEOP|nr:hypothetical protein K1T71_009833 [Dendrolimus kikuchii]